MVQVSRAPVPVWLRKRMASKRSTGIKGHPRHGRPFRYRLPVNLNPEVSDCTVSIPGSYRWVSTSKTSDQREPRPRHQGFELRNHSWLERYAHQSWYWMVRNEWFVCRDITPQGLRKITRILGWLDPQHCFFLEASCLGRHGTQTQKVIDRIQLFDGARSVFRVGARLQSLRQSFSLYRGIFEL